MSKYKTLFGDSATFFLAKFGSKLILFLLVPLYTFCLTKEEYGIAELITTGCELVIPILSLGIGNAVYRFGFDDSISDEDILKSFYIIFLLLSISVGIIIMCIGVSNRTINLGGLLWGLIILSFFNETYGLYIKSKGHTILFSVDSLIYILSLLILDILFLFVCKLKIQGYLLAILISKFISITYMFVFGKERKLVTLSSVNFSILKEMILYSFPLVANSLFCWAMTYLDKYMLGFMINLGSVGIYTVASKIPAMITTVSSVFVDAFTVSLLRDSSRIDCKFYDNIFNFFNIMLFYLLLVIQVIIIPFMHIYVSSDYYSSIPVIPFLLMGALFMSYSSFFGAVFGAVKKSGIFMQSSLCGVTINLILNCLLIPRFGMIGAAISTMVSYALTALYRYFKTMDYVYYSYPKINIFLSVLVLVIQTIVVSLGYYVYLYSILAFIILSYINKTEIKLIYKECRNFLERNI